MATPTTPPAASPASSPSPPTIHASKRRRCRGTADAATGNSPLRGGGGGAAPPSSSSQPAPLSLPPPPATVSAPGFDPLDPDADPTPRSLRAHKESHSMDHSSSGLPRDIPFYLLQEITDGFSKECKLGSGAFGEVYKGTFSNGNAIAVKKLSQMNLDNDDQFQKEVTYLLNLKHQNIVQLIGYCAETKWVSAKVGGRYVLAEVRQRLLCFEYLNNRSLREHISDESCGLKWHIRYKIIRGICCGLHYLHTECNMVHLDLKPTNILLDHGMVPKVADFGISRLFGDQQSRTITATIKGTFGYMAPEYINNGLISYKADMFSLGVIIIEVMTGRRGYPHSTGGEGSSVPFTEKVIANWRKRFETKAMHISSEKYIEQVKTCITIGLMCVNAEPNNRPSVGDINRMLNILPQT